MLNLRKEGAIQRSGGRHSSSSSTAPGGLGIRTTMTDTHLIFTTRIFGALTEELGSADPYADYRTRSRRRRTIGTVSRGGERSRNSRSSSWMQTGDEADLSADMDASDFVKDEEEGGAWGEEGESYELQSRSPSNSLVSPSSTFAASTSTKSNSASASSSKPKGGSRSGFGVIVSTSSAPGSGSGSNSGLGSFSGASSVGTRSRGSSHRGVRGRSGYGSGSERWERPSPDHDHDLPPQSASTLVGSEPPLSAHPLLHSPIPASPSPNSASPSPLSGLSGERRAYPPYPPALPTSSLPPNISQQRQPSYSQSHSRSHSSGRGRGFSPGPEARGALHQYRHTRHRSVDHAPGLGLEPSLELGIYSGSRGRDSDEGIGGGPEEGGGDIEAQSGPLHASGANLSASVVETTSRERRQRSGSGRGREGYGLQQENG